MGTDRFEGILFGIDTFELKVGFFTPHLQLFDLKGDVFTTFALEVDLF